MRGRSYAQVVAADGGLLPPLSWKNPADSVLYTTEQLHCREVLRWKASAVIHTLASKCGHDAFLSVLRGLISAAQAARSGGGGAAAANAPPPWVLQTSALTKQVAQVRPRARVCWGAGARGT